MTDSSRKQYGKNISSENFLHMESNLISKSSVMLEFLLLCETTHTHTHTNLLHYAELFLTLTFIWEKIIHKIQILDLSHIHSIFSDQYDYSRDHHMWSLLASYKMITLIHLLIFDQLDQLN